MKTTPATTRRSSRLNNGILPAHLAAHEVTLTTPGRGRGTRFRRSRSNGPPAPGIAEMDPPDGAVGVDPPPPPYLEDSMNDAVSHAELTSAVAKAVADAELPARIVQMQELMRRMDEMCTTMNDTRRALHEERCARESADRARDQAEQELARLKQSQSTAAPSVVTSTQSTVSKGETNVSTENANATQSVANTISTPQTATTAPHVSNACATEQVGASEIVANISISSGPSQLTTTTYTSAPSGISAPSAQPPVVSVPFVPAVPPVPFISPGNTAPPDSTYTSAPTATNLVLGGQSAVQNAANSSSMVTASPFPYVQSHGTYPAPSQTSSLSGSSFYSAMSSQSLPVCMFNCLVPPGGVCVHNNPYTQSLPQSSTSHLATIPNPYAVSIMPPSTVRCLPNAEMLQLPSAHHSSAVQRPPPSAYYPSSTVHQSSAVHYPPSSAAYYAPPAAPSQPSAVHIQEPAAYNQPSAAFRPPFFNQNPQFSAQVPPPAQTFLPHMQPPQQNGFYPASHMQPLPVVLPRNTNGFTRQMLMELPRFSGKPEEWPNFYTTFCQTTASFGYSTLDNLYRLQQSLSGEARQAVEPMLIHHENVDRVISSLAFRFGRPELLAQSQLEKVKALKPFNEQQIDQLVPFASTVENLVAFLRTGQCEYELVNPTLLSELVGKLPINKRLEWTQYSANIMPRATIAHFSHWLIIMSQYVSLAQIHPSSSSQPPPSRPSNTSQRSQKATVMLVNENSTAEQALAGQACSFCSKNHRSGDCFTFRDWTTEQRWDEVKRLQLCFYCLGSGHITSHCKNKRRCVVDDCRQSHHPLLHTSKPASDQPANSRTVSGIVNRRRPVVKRNNQPNSAQPVEQQPPSRPFATNQPPNSSAPVQAAAFNHCKEDNRQLPLLFKILPVTLHSAKGAVSTYAFLDEGSDVSLIDEELAVALGLSGSPTKINLNWFGNLSKTVTTQNVSFDISAVSNGSRRFRMDCVKTVPNINLPTQTVKMSTIPASQRCMKRLPIAEYELAKAKLLIGLDYSHLAAPKQTVRGTLATPTVIKTDLGWIVYGRQSQECATAAHCLHVRKSETEIDELVRDYFSTENFGVKAPTRELLSADNTRAQRILAETTVRVGARFQTGLLWRRDDTKLPDNYDMAMRRLLSVERKMSKDATYAALYRENMLNYIKKGYARRLTEAEVARVDSRTWYLPHFGVANDHKPGKLRMVFDAAACVHGISLNTVLLSGPDFNPPLTDILFKFRVGKIGVCGDIREMYHQVLIQPSDRCAQRFIWRDGDASRPPDVYEMVAMTFGATCSPAAAHFVKNMNADQNAIEFPAAVEPIKKLHYVDDYVASFATSSEASEVTLAVTEVHRRGGFELRNFVSNNDDVLSACGAKRSEKSLVRLQPESPTSASRILGMCWDTHNDEFRFEPNFVNVDKSVMTGKRPPTKRQVLSIAMSVFDPFGILADFMLHAKLLVQDLWRAGCGWDETIPQSLNERWVNWCSQLDTLRHCRLTRCYSPHLKQSASVQLHVFADASEAAFAAVAYWRVQHEDTFTVSFITGKTKCAPLKSLSIPRLELQAATLATRLLATIRSCHDVHIHRTVLWTDSQTVMQWIRSDHRQYKPFVAARVSEILDETKEENWRWIPTHSNVADDATRAASAPRFNNGSRWLRGPSFLSEPEENWPTSPDDACETTKKDFTEMRRRFVGYVSVTVNALINPNRFSVYERMLRATAWALRFVRNARSGRRGHERTTGELTVLESRDAELLLCRLAQAEAFADEYDALANSRTVDPSSSIVKLMPYLDERGTMRIYGRADAADPVFLSASAKRPIVMPKNHRLTWLIVDSHHRRMCHQNDSAVVCAIRQKFWVPHLRSAVRRSRRECRKCKLRAVRPMPPVMGQLPADRLTPYIRPFSYTGLDFFGPLLVTVGRRQEKRWAALFTCLTVRAVHIELAADMTTDACLLCVRNFANVRGVPIRIRSDNGTNFIGASKVVRDTPDFFDDVRMRRELTNLGIEWVLNSPGHPEAGGCWERMVQCVKRVLVTTLDETAPRVETLRTLLIEAANIVNSRPLTHVPVSPEDEEPLTPNHFLIGGSSSSTIPSDLDSKIWCLRKQWRIAQHLTSRFWSQWVKSYLPELTRRTKWHQERPPIQIGDLVLICDANQSRNEWRRGRVDGVYPGPDGRIRNVDVKTVAGMLRRPVSKLAVLDVANDRNEPVVELVHGGEDVATPEHKA